MAKVEYQEKVHILEIDGKEYPVAPRTGALEQRIISEHDEKLNELTEYERYKALITILLGENAFSELFPQGEGENLNKMAQVAYHAQKEYNAEALDFEKQKMDDANEILFGDMDTVNAKIAKMNKEVEKLEAKAKLTQQTRKRKK